MSLEKGKKMEFARVLADIISGSQLSPEDAYCEVIINNLLYVCRGKKRSRKFNDKVFGPRYK